MLLLWDLILKTEHFPPHCGKKNSSITWFCEYYAGSWNMKNKHGVTEHRDIAKLFQIWSPLNTWHGSDSYGFRNWAKSLLSQGIFVIYDPLYDTKGMSTPQQKIMTEVTAGAPCAGFGRAGSCAESHVVIAEGSEVQISLGQISSI